ncbi:hypothetical protein MMC25_005003 [Agyrium rufum]|nr:hypothetical protein [Agyrium rufum]
MLVIALGTLLFAKYASAAPAATRPTVTISAGQVVGVNIAVPSASVTINKYLGIPFAASPPVRFAPPSAPAIFNAPLDASSFKAACIQQFVDPPFTRNFTMAVFNNPGGPPPAESEDCLYLNVFTPSSPTPKGGRTVMFWIYGGDLQFGTASVAAYDGSSFAANQDVVVVTINYRTNVFGFPNSPQIPTAQQNIGFLDQRQALSWVQSNIAAFGGNPGAVTIFGQSAGGYSVKQLLANPPSPLPYRAAILESQAASLTGDSEANWETLATALDCTAGDQLACVRKAPATQIKNIIETAMLAFAPVEDGATFTKNVAPNLFSKKFAQVPFFLGTNSQEGRVFAAAAGLQLPGATTSAFLNATFPGQPLIQQVISKAYAPVANSPYLLASAVITDSSFTCPNSLLAGAAALNGYAVWRYYFDAAFPNTQLFPDAGVYHSSEIPEVFGTYSSAGATAQQIALSKYMQTTWASFAKNPAAGPDWPRYLSDNGVELGDLGENGSTGEKTIAEAPIDANCLIYDPTILAGGI